MTRQIGSALASFAQDDVAQNAVFEFEEAVEFFDQRGHEARVDDDVDAFGLFVDGVSQAAHFGNAGVVNGALGAPRSML